MKKWTISACILSLATAIVFLVASPAVSQDNAADSVRILMEKIKADKKLLVASNMDLTESEAKAFWPVYEEYQGELDAINKFTAQLVGSFRADYGTDAFTDEKADQLIVKMVDIEKAEAELRATFVPKLKKALPSKKVARYLQIENKIRALVKYDIAREVPLVP
jgi:hypothetical protein